MAFTVKHKRSGDKDKAPAAGVMTPGELAINYHVDSPALYVKDSAGAVVKIAGAGSASTPDATETVKGIAEIATQAEVTAGTDDARIVSPLKLKQALDALPPGTTVAAVAPTTPENGQAFFDTTTNTLKVWDGSAWRTSQPAASETVAGIAEIATQAEVTAGTDDTRIVSPLKLKQAIDALPPGTTVSPAAPAAPEDGQAWFDSTNTVLKVWDSTAWQPAVATSAALWTRGGGGLIPATAADNVYVGGTAAAPKIKLTAADGEATFAGNTLINGKAYIFEKTGAGQLGHRHEFTAGGYFIKNDNNSAATVTFTANGQGTFDSDVKIGGTLPLAPNIELKGSDGSGTFTGSVKTANPSGSYGTLYPEGQFWLSTDPAVTSPTISVQPLGGNQTFGVFKDGTLKIGNNLQADLNVNIKLEPDGNATFAGDVKIGGTLPASPNITLKADGSATLKTSTGGSNALDWTGNGALAITSNRSDIDYVFGVSKGGTAKFQVLGDGTTRLGGTLPASPNIKLNATDGSATFKGAITIEQAAGNAHKLSTRGGAKQDLLIEPSSDLYINCPIVNFHDNDDSNPKIQLKGSDGTATFAGTVTGNRDNLAIIGGNFTTNSASDGTPAIQARNFDDGGTVFQGRRKAGTITSAIKADGSATFTGTVTATVVPPSDAKFKENITPANPQLADVVALGKQLKNFDWNDDAPLNEELRAVRQLGLIAQEAEVISPGIVKTIKRTKQGKMLTKGKTIPAVVKPGRTIPAEYRKEKTKKGGFEEVLVTPEQIIPEQIITPEQVIEPTYEELDDSFKGISHDALIMKLLGAVAELSAEVEALKAAKTRR